MREYIDYTIYCYRFKLGMFILKLGKRILKKEFEQHAKNKQMQQMFGNY